MSDIKLAVELLKEAREQAESEVFALTFPFENSLGISCKVFNIKDPIENPVGNIFKIKVRFNFLGDEVALSSSVCADELSIKDQRQKVIEQISAEILNMISKRLEDRALDDLTKLLYRELSGYRNI